MKKFALVRNGQVVATYSCETRAQAELSAQVYDLSRTPAGRQIVGLEHMIDGLGTDARHIDAVHGAQSAEDYARRLKESRYTFQTGGPLWLRGE